MWLCTSVMHRTCHPQETQSRLTRLHVLVVSGRSALRNRHGGSGDGETTAGCRMGSTRRQAGNLTVGRLELIASDLLRGASPGSFVSSDSSNLPSPVNRFVGRHFGGSRTS